MKRKPIFLFLLAVTVLALTGCAASAVNGGNQAENINPPAGATLLTNYIPAPSADPTEPFIAPTEPPVLLSEEAVASIALSHAGLTKEQVTGLRVVFDPDDGVAEFDVKFIYDNVKYEYELHGYTGLILSRELDRLPQDLPPETLPAQEDPKRITEEEAALIALQHAGLTKDQATGLRVKLDRDDGIWEYEVEFRLDAWEYEYEIHAENGTILSWDKENEKYD